MAFALYIGLFNRESVVYLIYHITTRLSRRYYVKLSYSTATNPLSIGPVLPYILLSLTRTLPIKLLPDYLLNRLLLRS